MFDLTNEQSFLNIRAWLEQLKLHSSIERPDIILCGNKADLEQRRVIDWTRANNEATKYGIPYFETSSVNGFNVTLAIEYLLQIVLTRMDNVVERTATKLMVNGAYGPDEKHPFKLHSDHGHSRNNCYC